MATTTTTTISATDLANRPAKMPTGDAASKFAPRDPSYSALPRPPVYEDKHKEREYLKGRLAAAFRIFGKLGYADGIEGHITLRDPVDPETFWVNPFGLAFQHIKSSDLVQTDHAGNVIGGGPLRLINKAAYKIHAAVHKARPDVICAAHCHSNYGRSWCAFGKPLEMTTQDACVFYNDHAVYSSYCGIVNTDEESARIAQVLGQNKAVLMQHHGLLTVGETVEATVHWYTTLEKSCHSQLMIDAAAAGRGEKAPLIGDEEALGSWKVLGAPLTGWFSAKPMFDVIHEETQGGHLK